MANRDIKKETKKKKKTDTKTMPSFKPEISEPELVGKHKKKA